MSGARRGAWPARHHPDWWAFAAHRVSGLALLLFLPLHFLVLTLAVHEEAAFDGFVAWTERPLVKAAEAVLVALLATHLAGGLRLLALELLPWRPLRSDLAAMGVALGIATGLLFLLAA